MNILIFFGILTAVSFVFGMATRYAWEFFRMRQLGDAKLFIKSLRKRQMIIFLESEGRGVFRTIVTAYQNIGVTNNRELVILPEGSVKPCLNLNASQIMHGDLYRSLAVPTEFLTVLHNLRDNGLNDKEITDIFYKIMNFNEKQLKENETNSLNDFIKNVNFDTYNKTQIKADPEYAKLSDDKKTEQHEAYVTEQIGLFEKVNPDVRAVKVYRAMPSVVKNFLQTGVNRVSLEMMLSNKMLQEAFKNAGRGTTIQVLVGVGLMILLIFLGLKFGLPAISDFMSAGSSLASIPARVGG